ncbi:hypothetical protein [Hippea alviniae]|uniref:hypothetical protein n=1 Tax=Hippea alviniae TaxID=1279027 RepID=UPI0003B5EA63|nr:hypothetical protein [Hippea alviniae]
MNFYFLKKTFNYMFEELVLFVPPLLVFLILFSVAIVFGIGMSANILINHPPTKPTAYLIAFLFSFFSFFLSVISGSLVIYMTYEKEESGRANLSTSFSEVMNRIGAVILASLLVSIVVSIGFALFVIPGFIALLFFMFTLQEILLSEKEIGESIKGSFNLVKDNFGEVFICFLAVIIIDMLISTVLKFVPLFGGILAQMFSVVFANVSFTLIYIELKDKETEFSHQ